MSKIMISSYLVYLTDGSSFRDRKPRHTGGEQDSRRGFVDLQSEFLKFRQACDTIKDTGVLRGLIKEWKSIAGPQTSIGTVAIDVSLHIEIHTFIPDAVHKLALLEEATEAAVSVSGGSAKEQKKNFSKAQTLVLELASGHCRSDINPRVYKEELVQSCLRAMQHLPQSPEKEELDALFQVGLEKDMVRMTFLKTSPSLSSRKVKSTEAQPATSAPSGAAAESEEEPEEEEDPAIEEAIERAARTPSPEPRTGAIDAEVLLTYTDFSASDLISTAIAIVENSPGDEAEIELARQIMQMARESIRAQTPGVADPEFAFFDKEFCDSASDSIEKSMACIPLDREVARKFKEIARRRLTDLKATVRQTDMTQSLISKAEVNFLKLSMMLP